VLRCITAPRGVSTLHTDASGPAPPDAFGPFRVLHQIGAGVLGPVFRAYQPDPGRLVAVKQFRLDLPPENSHRFVAALEQLIAADLTHMGIAAPLAAGQTDNTPFLALDFVAAESFDVVIRDYGPAPVTEALRIATQLGGALDFAAAVNVFHGTLHPRDVLVSADDTRVTGLGIAQALEQLGVTPPVRRPYTAPERLAGETWDRRADTFSLAALVFEMLFGRRIAGVGLDAAEAITEFDNVDLVSLRGLFAKALAENPAERYDSALAFAEALDAVVSQPASPPQAGNQRRLRTSGTKSAAGAAAGLRRTRSAADAGGTVRTRARTRRTQAPGRTDRFGCQRPHRSRPSRTRARA
jgi:serine/threonine protein kinase